MNDKSPDLIDRLQAHRRHAMNCALEQSDAVYTASSMRILAADLEHACDQLLYLGVEVEALHARLATQQPQGVPEGLVLVPVEPTDSILNNMHGRNLVYATDAELMEAWAEIIAAASSPERQG